MRFYTLGRTGLKISTIALGCANFGGVGSTPELFGKAATREEFFAVMDRAWTLGIYLLRHRQFLWRRLERAVCRGMVETERIKHPPAADLEH